MAGALKTPRESTVVVGTIRGAYGVRGWVKVESYTEPVANIVHYTPWLIRHRGTQRAMAVVRGRGHGDAVVAQIEGVNDRDAAMLLKGAEIAVERDALPRLGPGEFYWADLIGLNVVTETGKQLGAVAEMMETGANDVLVVRGEQDRLIPFVRETVVKDVDLVKRQIVVAWDDED